MRPGDKLANFTITVDRSLSDSSESWQDHSEQCLYHDGAVPDGATVHLNCSEPVVGRYLTVMVNTTDALHFCEIEVLGIPFSEGLLNSCCLTPRITAKVTFKRKTFYHSTCKNSFSLPLLRL